ncbi:MAG: hypothetical protein ACXW2U_03825 [Telluria sp.]
MGNSLYNKIHLGRSTVFGTTRMRNAFLLGAFVGIGLALLAYRTMR